VKFLTEGGHRERVTDGELGYLLGERRLARDRHRRPGRHPPRTPVGWTYNAELDTIDVGGHSVERTKKFRDVVRTGRAAVVIDDVLPPLAATRAQGPGRAEAVGPPAALIRIRPERVVSWGIERRELGARHARDTA
jgi:pyridoxamine 5'-phosphate oxidase family protein